MLSPLDRALELARPSVWACRHRIIDDRPWTFAGREFLIDIHDETAANVAVRKGNQVGVTEAVMNIACADVDARIPTMFVLPTERVRDRHVSARVNTIIRQSDYLRAMFDESDSLRVKTSSGTPLYFEGSNSKSGAHSVPVGSLIIDEVDRCIQSALPEFEKRLSGQESPRLRAISTPTYPGRGIDARFERSDQRFWAIACPHCGHRGTLDFDDATVPSFPEIVAVMRWDGWPETRFNSHDDREAAAKTARLECTGCGKRWTHAERKAAVSAGEWVARCPGRDAAGFHVPQVLSPVRTAADFVLDYFESIADEDTGARPGAVRTFHNGVRGIAYLATTEKIDRAEVEALVSNATHGKEAVLCAGVDVGAWKHVCVGALVGEKSATWEFHKFRTFAAVLAFLNARGVAVAVWDAWPEKEAVETICAEDEGRSFRAWTPADQLVPLVTDEENRIVRISRVSFVSAVLARIRNKSALIARNELTDEACSHLTRVTVVDDVAANGDPVRRVVKLSSEDHCLWAALYLEVALRRTGGTGGELEIHEDKTFGREDGHGFASPLSSRMDKSIGVRDLGDEEAFEGAVLDQGFSAW